MNTPLKGKKVVMVIASQNFRDEEFAEPYGALTNAGASVKVACSRLAPAKGMLGRQVTPDLLLKDVSAADYDAVVFVGGAGAQEYFADETAHRIAREAVEKGRLLGAICIAPAILANAGVLKERKATCFPSVGSVLRKAGATVVAEGVVKDGKLVTADGPANARPFAAALIEALTP